MEGDPVLFDRFQREQEIGRKLDHPGVMKVFTDDDHSQLYMVMEWVEGRLLRQVLNEAGKLPPERAVKIALGIADALDYIHYARRRPSRFEAGKHHDRRRGPHQAD